MGTGLLLVAGARHLEHPFAQLGDRLCTIDTPISWAISSTSTRPSRSNTTAKPSAALSTPLTGWRGTIWRCRNSPAGSAWPIRSSNTSIATTRVPNVKLVTSRTVGGMRRDMMASPVSASTRPVSCGMNRLIGPCRSR